MTYIIVLPYPPSLNRYWRAVRGRVLISKAGREYRKHIRQEAAMLRCMGDIPEDPLVGRLSVHITMHAPDNRRRDVDNVPKCVLDSLTAAGVWVDDSQLDELCITRGTMKRGGLLVIEITELDEEKS